MSTRSELVNNTYTVYSGPIWAATVTRGTYHSRESTGTNRVTFEDFANPHPYNLIINDVAHGVLRRDMVNNVNGTLVTEYTSDTGFSYTFAPFTQEDEQKLVSKLAERMRESEFDAGVFAAELGKTTELLVSKAVQVISIVRELRKGNLTKAIALFVSATPGTKTRNKCLNRMIAYENCIRRNSALSKLTSRMTSGSGRARSKRFRSCRSPNCDFSADVAGQWLELNLALKPLVSDVFALSQTIDNWSRDKKSRTSARRSVPGVINQVFPTEREGTVEQRRQYIAYTASQFSVSQKIGLRDPEVVLWELMPLSFFLDYFLPIGQFLASAAVLNDSLAQFVQTNTQFVDIRGTSSLRVPRTGTVAYEWNYNTTPDVRPSLKSVVMQRIVLSSLDVPAPTWRTPLQFTGAPATRFANALALAFKAFAG